MLLKLVARAAVKPQNTTPSDGQFGEAVSLLPHRVAGMSGALALKRDCGHTRHLMSAAVRAALSVSAIVIALSGQSLVQL